ncbi:MAG: reverse transcriptase domain-containing protein [Halioglobus sp.]
MDSRVPLTTEPDNRISLQHAFESTFHQKFEFSDFVHCSLGPELEQFRIRDRVVYRPSRKYKRYLRFLNSFIFDFASVNSEVAFGYRKGKNSVSALEPHASNKYFFLSDIDKFFDRASSSNVASIIDTKVSNSPIEDICDYRSRILEMVTKDDRIPVGYPTSPPISNAHLYEFDNAIQAHCLDHQLIYSRYSDDIIISTDDKDKLENIEQLVTSCLHEFAGLNFNLNPEKTVTLHRGNKIKVLGLVLLPNGRITIDRRKKSRFETLFHYYINDREKYNDCLEAFFRGNVSLVRGQFNHVNSIEPEYTDKLRRKYGSFVIDYFLNDPAG